MKSGLDSSIDRTRTLPWRCSVAKAQQQPTGKGSGDLRVEEAVAIIAIDILLAVPIIAASRTVHVNIGRH